MSPLRSAVQLSVAVAVFVVCAGIGAFADTARRSAVAWLAGAGAPASRLQLGVESGAHVMRIRNLTSDTWPSCVVMLDGGYESPPLVIEPRALTRVPYAIFSDGEKALSDADGFTHAFRAVAVSCADGQTRREFIELR